MSAPATESSRSRDLPEPLGPESLTWRYFGRWIGFAGGPSVQLLQVMHPHLGLGVQEHSTVFVEPFQRLWRSMYPIYGVIYDGERARDTARQVRGFHDDIGGTDAAGVRYHALNPETYHWAHATFVYGLVYGFSDLLGPFTRAEQERLYAESVRWYRLYGMSTREVPPDLDAFDAYVEHYTTNVLEPTPVARWLLDTFENPPPMPGLGWLPDPAWRALRLPFVAQSRLLTGGFLPPVVRDKLGIPWDDARERSFRRVIANLRTADRLLPAPWRYHPRARAGWRAQAARRGVRTRDLIANPPTA